MENTFPSRFKHGDAVKVILQDKGSFDAFVNAIHFYVGKVKYDLEIRFNDGTATRVYNVDSAFIENMEVNKKTTAELMHDIASGNILKG